jgi:flagellar hook-length control protein FliK
MTISSIETSSPTASNAKIDFAANPNDPSTRTENSEFGQIMSGVMQSSAEVKAMTAGQEVAGSSGLQPGFPGSFGGNLGASLGGDFLKAVNLGPHMNVITSEATVPDEQSLEAFARSQGLDETAVQWLMGSTPVIPVTNPVTLPDGTQPLNNSAMLSAMNANSSSIASGQMFAPLSVGVPDATNQVASPFSNPLVSGMNVANSTTSLGVPGATESPGQTAAVNPPATTNVSKPETNLLPNALTAAALWAMTQATEKAREASPAQEDPSEVAKVQINLMASPAPAAFWMLRNPQAVTPSKEPVTTASGIALSEIDLTETATPELLENLSQTLAEGAALNTPAAASDQPTPLSGHPHRLDLTAAARQDAQNPDASASAPDSGNAQRSENVQNLAEKMGQAVGQRILSEIEKGQWHLKLSLRPATLGHIEVEMRMRSGELDAVFTAPQAVTRELLQEGMSKLKDTLNQMGMDVASMQVGDGQTQQRGGESTPGQMSKSTKTNSDDSKSSLSAVQAPLSRMKMGQDGWDVLV